MDKSVALDTAPHWELRLIKYSNQPLSLPDVDSTSRELILNGTSLFADPS